MTIWSPKRAVVRHVRIGHQQIVAADPGHAVSGHGAAVHGDRFAEYVAIADFQAGGLAFVLLVLRRIADRGELINLVVGADAGRTIDDRVRPHPSAGANHHAGADDTERSDFGIRSNLRLRRDHRARIDHPSSPDAPATLASELLAPGTLVSGATMISADATTAPSTSARQSNFQIPLKARFRVALRMDLVAGLDGLAEARVVDRDEIKARIGVRHDIHGLERENTAGLRQCLDDHHARHHGPMREVSREKRLVEGHVLDAHGRTAPPGSRARDRPAKTDTDAAAAA